MGHGRGELGPEGLESGAYLHLSRTFLCRCECVWAILCVCGSAVRRLRLSRSRLSLSKRCVPARRSISRREQRCEHAHRFFRSENAYIACTFSRPIKNVNPRVMVCHYTL